MLAYFYLYPHSSKVPNFQPRGLLSSLRKMLKIYSRAKPDTKEEEYLNKHFKKNRTRTSH